MLRTDASVLAFAEGRSVGLRIHGLDAMRGITMALVVVLHAALAYAVIPIPNLIWAVPTRTHSLYSIYYVGGPWVSHHLSS